MCFCFCFFFKFTLSSLKNYNEIRSYNALDTDADPGTLPHLIALCDKEAFKS